MSCLNYDLFSSLFQMTPEDVVFLASPLTFDPSVVEMFLALSAGARLLMVPSAVRRMPGRLASVLFRRNATTVLQVNGQGSFRESLMLELSDNSTKNHQSRDGLFLNVATFVFEF